MIEGSCHLRRGAGVSTDRRYGVLWAYDCEDERIRVSGPTRVYAWGSRKLGSASVFGSRMR